ncbi:MAG: DUF58 domain-containing protein [Gemmatimonadales bacterium]|nr:DUF58 domain-containing protein [Gemmatimonadales bacterium]
MTRPAWHDAALAAALAQLPIGARRVGAGVAEGRHASRLPGTGLEFAQYRGYQPGDDLRHVDWKLLARSDRLYVREADAETAIPIRFLLDATASMAHTEDGIVKFDAARRIVAALAECAVRQGDLPSLAVLSHVGGTVPPSRDRRQADRIIDALDRAAPAGSFPARVETAIAATGGGRDGALVLVTDWHDPDDVLRPALERSGLDCTIVVLRTPRERDVAYGEPVTLEDLETGEQVVVDDDARHVRNARLEVETEAARRGGIDVVMVDCQSPLAPALAGWLAGRVGRR